MIQGREAALARDAGSLAAVEAAQPNSMRGHGGSGQGPGSRIERQGCAMSHPTPQSTFASMAGCTWPA